MEQGAGRDVAECGGRGMEGPGKLIAITPTSMWSDLLEEQNGDIRNLRRLRWGGAVREEHFVQV